jgi:hypothetical protein
MYYVRACDHHDTGPFPFCTAAAIVRATVSVYRRKGVYPWSDQHGRWVVAENDCPLVVIWVADEGGRIIPLDTRESV